MRRYDAGMAYEDLDGVDWAVLDEVQASNRPADIASGLGLTEDDVLTALSHLEDERFVERPRGTTLGNGGEAYIITAEGRKALKRRPQSD